MEPRRFIALFLLLSCYVYVGVSQSSAGVAECAKQLTPCVPFLHSSSPPASCCDPLKTVVTDDAHCVCATFNNPSFLSTLGLTKELGLKFVKACGADIDTSICKNGTEPARSPASGTPADATPANVAPPAGSSSNITTTNSAANGISRHGGSIIVGFMMALFLSIYH